MNTCTRFSVDCWSFLRFFFSFPKIQIVLQMGKWGEYFETCTSVLITKARLPTLLTRVGFSRSC